MVNNLRGPAERRQYKEVGHGRVAKVKSEDERKTKTLLSFIFSFVVGPFIPLIGEVHGTRLFSMHGHEGSSLSVFN